MYLLDIFVRAISLLTLVGFQCNFTGLIRTKTSFTNRLHVMLNLIWTSYCPLLYLLNIFVRAISLLPLFGAQCNFTGLINTKSSFTYRWHVMIDLIWRSYGPLLYLLIYFFVRAIYLLSLVWLQCNFTGLISTKSGCAYRWHVMIDPVF